MATITREDDNDAPPRRRRVRAILALAVALVAIAAVVIGVSIAREAARTVPSFPSLAEHPDRSIHGTVAYFAADWCVRIVAASGSPDKPVLCLPKGQDVEAAQRLGKEIGPQLVWRPDGRLEVTMFRMTGPPGPGPTFRRGWQKVVDVRTGAVEDVPATEVPATANVTTHPTVSPSGDRITATSSSGGEVKIVLTDRTGASRTIMSAHGPGSYTYALSSAFWAPGWNWVAADDGRILVVTTGDPAVTRVLVRPADSGFDPTLARFAVTDADLLTPAG